MKTQTVIAAFIAAIGTENTGGDCLADFVQLKSGKAVVISDEIVAVYDNPNDFLNDDGNGDVEKARYLNGPEPFMRSADVAPWAFIDRVTTYEPAGPASVDLLILLDGRVLGIDSESIVLYPSMQAFDAITGGDTTCDVFTMSLEAEERAA